jgi:hypothetical protein
LLRVSSRSSSDHTVRSQFLGISPSYDI